MRKTSNLKRCIKHTKKAKKYEGKADYHAALASIYLAITEEEGISEFRHAVDAALFEVDLDEDEP